MDHGSPTCKRNLTSVEAGTVLVECSPTVLDEIRETALDESRRHNCGLLFSSGKVGLGGVLFGKREETRVRIVSLRSLVSDRSSSRSTTLGEADRQAFLIALISGAPDGEASGLEPVGWFRAHPASNLSLSRRDLEVFNYFFMEPWQIGLVMRPAISAPTKAKYFVREANGSIRPQNGYLELVVPTLAGGSGLRMEWGPLPKAENLHSARLAARPAMRPFYPRRPATPIWPAVTMLGLLITSALNIGYWWMTPSDQIPLHGTLEHLPAANASAKPHGQPGPKGAALWKQWEDEVLQKHQQAVALQESASLREKSEEEAVHKRLEELVSGLPKPPDAVARLPMKPTAPDRNSASPRPLPQERPTAPRLKQWPEQLLLTSPAVESQEAGHSQLSVTLPQNATAPELALTVERKTALSRAPRSEQSSVAPVVAKTFPTPLTDARQLLATNRPSIVVRTEVAPVNLPTAGRGPAFGNFREARPLHQVDPVVPANLAPGEAEVEIYLKIDEIGRAVKIESISRKGTLGSVVVTAAAKATRQWRFEPAKLGDCNIPSQMMIRFYLISSK